MENEKIQWHPAFDAALQIELAEDADNLIFICMFLSVRYRKDQAN